MASHDFTTVLRSPRIKDITGQSFGLLRVLAFAELRRTSLRGGPKAFWRCLCMCGAETIVASSKLKNGHTRSCGCLAAAHGTSEVERKVHQTEYQCFMAMWARCIIKTNPNYINYGGRGIRICPRWQIFDAFLEDMGPRPGPGYSIERENNDGNYTPDNCRWATRKEQNRNNRHVHLITFQGATQCVSEWAEQLGLPYPTLQWRLQQGWELERALQPQTRRRHDRLLTFQGETMLASQWAKRLGILYATLSWRLRQGWSLEQAFTPFPTKDTEDHSGILSS